VTYAEGAYLYGFPDHTGGGELSGRHQQVIHESLNHGTHVYAEDKGYGSPITLYFETKSRNPLFIPLDGGGVGVCLGSRSTRMRRSSSDISSSFIERLPEHVSLGT
jgi:hypothetical protein